MAELLLDIEIEPLAEGGYLATSTVLPGLVAQGRTVAETMEIAQDVARKLIESYREHGDPMPPGVGADAGLRPDEHASVKIPVAVDLDAAA